MLAHNQVSFGPKIRVIYLCSHISIYQVVFDPNIVSASTLMDFFFVIHDPTTLNSQGSPNILFSNILTYMNGSNPFSYVL